MKIEIPVIRQEIRLCDYAPEFGDQVISVRVNPPRGTLDQILALRADLKGKDPLMIDKFAGILADLWGWPAEDVLQLFEHARETDPRLFVWLAVETFLKVRDHRLAVKKN